MKKRRSYLREWKRLRIGDAVTGKDPMGVRSMKTYVVLDKAIMSGRLWVLFDNELSIDRASDWKKFFPDPIDTNSD